MYQFKAEYQNARVTVKTNSFGKVEINTSNADANKWAVVPELAFMIEEVGKREAITVANVSEKAKEWADNFPERLTDKPPYSNMTLSQLREMFPDIKATSKKAFIEQL